MSTTIDQRIVEMRFDNRHFEENVRTSMSTLDKLKEKLHLKGATTGIENINSAVRKVDVSSLGSSVEKVGLKFNGLYTMADQALRNLENRIEQTARNMVSALTIDPIKTGFSEYETQIGATQTIYVNVKQKGKTLDDVNAALDELNTYADQTIYNFTEMTKNIGLFVNAGVGLDESVAAIKGFSNAAAMAGTDSTRTAQAMYQLSQAMSSGTVKLMDWRSLETANIAGERFQETIKETARAHGIAIDDMIAEEGSLRETLHTGWLTADLMAEALDHYTLSTETMTEAEIKANKERLKSLGYSDKQIDKLFELGTEANKAATEFKTFSDLWGGLKEAAQSGWSQTWRIIVGDFEQAKGIFTNLGNYLGGVISAWSDSRNTLLGGALNMSDPWSSITEKLEKAGLGKIKKVAETVGEVTDNLTKFQKIVDQVWIGDFGNSDTGRYEKLEAAGYDHRVVQDLVNKGNDYKLTIEDIEESHKKFGLTMDKTSESTKKTADSIGKLSDEQLKNAGLTDAEIRLYRDLEEEAKRTGKSVSELADEMSKADGRTMILDGLKNVGKQLVKVFGAIKDAWSEIFPPMSVVTLYSVIKRFSDFTKGLEVSNDTAEKLKRTFKGVFAIIDIIATITGGALRTAFKMVSTVMDYFNVDILDVTAAFGDWIVKIRDWIDEHNLLTKGLEIMLPYLKDAAEGIKKWFDSLKDSDNLPRDIIQGLINGLKEGVSRVWDAIGEIATGIIDTFKEILGIHSPSTEFFEMGKNIIEGLVNGVVEGAPKVIEFFKELGLNVINSIKGFLSKTGEVTTEGMDGIGDIFRNIFGNINFGDIFATALAAGTIVFGKKMYDIFSALSEPLQGLSEMFEGIGDMFEGMGRMFTGIGKYFKAGGFKKKAKGILFLAEAVAVLAVALFLIASIDSDRLWESVGALGVLILGIAALAFAVSKMGAMEAESFNRFGIAMAAIGAAVLLVAFAMEKIGNLDKAAFDQASRVLLVMAGMMVILMYMTKFTGNAKRIDALGKMFIKIGAALILMSVAVKILGGIPLLALIKGGLAIAGLGVIIALLIWATELAGNNADKIAKTISKIAGALLVMTVVVAILGVIPPDVLSQGVKYTIALGAIIAGLIWATKLAGNNPEKLGRTIFAISLALGVLASVVVVLGRIDAGALAKGVIATVFLGGIITGLIAATKLAGNNAGKLALTLIAMSVAIAILAGIAVVLSIMDPGGLFKGIVAVAVLGLIMAGMIKATKGAKKCVGNLIAMTVAIGVMALAVAGLSFIRPDKLFGATVAIGLLMGIFAIIVNQSKGIKKKALGPLIVMTVIIGLIGVMLYVLSTLPTDSVLGTARSISKILVALTACLKIISTVRSVSISAFVALGAMVLVVYLLSKVLKGLADLNSENVLPNALALGALVLALSGAVLLLSLAGTGATAGLIAIGVLIALVAAMGLLLNNIDKIVSESKIEENLPILEKIAYAMGSMIGKIIAGFTASVGDGLPELAFNLSAFMLGLQPAFAVAENISDEAINGMKNLALIPGILAGANLKEALVSSLTGVSSIEKFISDLTLFADGMVAFSQSISGKIDEGAVTAAANAGLMLAQMNDTIPASGGLLQGILGEKDLSTFSSSLVAFGESIVLFSDTVAGNIDTEAVTAAANAGMIMTEMQKTIVPAGGVLQWITGEKDLTSFGLQLQCFGDSIVAFSNVVSKDGAINEEAVTAAATAGKIMTEMQKTIPATGGVLQWVTGQKELDKFGSQLVTFGYCIVDFSRVVSAEGAINKDAVQAAADAGSMMTKMNASIVPSGGVVEFFTGSQNMADFGTQLVSFGGALVTFSQTISGNIDEDSIEAAANAGMMMAKLQSSIDPVSKWKETFSGEKDLGDFGSQIKKFGKGIVGFSNVVSEGGGINQDAVEAAAKAGGIMAELQDAIPEDEWFDGKVSLDDFGKDLKKFGGYMADYSDEVSEVDNDVVTKSITSANKLVTLTERLTDVDTSGIENFKVGDIGEAIASYSDDVEYINTENISASITSANRLVGLIKSMVGLNTSGISSFETALTKLGNINVDTFVDTFSKASSGLTGVGSNIMDSIIKGAKSKQTTLSASILSMINKMSTALNKKKSSFLNIGKAYIDHIAKGLSNKKSTATNALGVVIAAAIAKARDYYQKFYNAGSYLVSGFANGISENAYKAEAKAKAMATAAKEAAEDALGIQSPSKVFYQIGDYTGQGFVNALDDFASKSYSAGAGMADNARKGLTNAIGRIKNIIDSDMDTQPTIRPVLDLSNVEAGTNKLNNMLNLGSSTRVLADVGTINSMMNGYNQNGGNADVVSAIDRLRKDLGNIGGDQYNLGDITYDDGSNISNAIKSIVKAARIERRV